MYCTQHISLHCYVNHCSHKLVKKAEGGATAQHVCKCVMQSASKVQQSVCAAVTKQGSKLMDVCCAYAFAKMPFEYASEGDWGD